MAIKRRLVAPDDFAMGNIVRPQPSVVYLASEEIEGCGSLRGPRVAEGGGGEEAEVMIVRALSFEDHKVSVLALDVKDLHGLEQVQDGVRHVVFRPLWDDVVLVGVVRLASATVRLAGEWVRFGGGLRGPRDD
jgi:hypothetical protein